MSTSAPEQPNRTEWPTPWEAQVWAHIEKTRRRGRDITHLWPPAVIEGVRKWVARGCDYTVKR